MEGNAGVIASVLNAAGVTVKLVEPEALPSAAVRFVVPTEAVVASP